MIKYICASSVQPRELLALENCKPRTKKKLRASSCIVPYPDHQHSFLPHLSVIACHSPNMFSIRSFARTAPRTISRLSTSALRTQSARPASLLQSAWRPARTQCAAAFSTSSIRRSEGEGDAELVAKLESEIQMENELKEDGGIPTSVKDYLENGPFEIIDTPGQEDVILTRKFGDEKYAIFTEPLFTFSDRF